MAPAVSWVCIMCVVLEVTLGGALFHADSVVSIHSPADSGVSIHSPFSSPIYITNGLQTSEDPLEKKEQELGQNQADACEFLNINTTKSESDFHEVKTLSRKSFFFYVKPESSFKKLVLKLNLQSVLYVSGDLYSDEDITLNAEDLTRVEGNQWKLVKVEHYQHRRRGFDRHSFRVSFGNTTLSCMTRDSWLLHGFKGFTMFADGGAKILFNCVPDDFNEASVAGYVFFSMWVMVGFMIVVTFLLAVLCSVWVYLKYQRKKKHASVLPMKYPIYDKFDEEVLERIKQKVEALRKGNSPTDPNTVVVSYATRYENPYVLDETRYGGVDGIGSEEHHYEDIEKYHKDVYVTDNLHQNPADDGRNVDTIYETLPSFENYLEKREDNAILSSRYMTS